MCESQPIIRHLLVSAAQVILKQHIKCITVHRLSSCHQLHHGSLQRAHMSQQGDDDRDDVNGGDEDDVDYDDDDDDNDDRLLTLLVRDVITSKRFI